MNRIFLVGDTHGEIELKKLSSKNFKQKNLSKDDFVVVLGDFGLVWNIIESKAERYWMKWLNDKPFTTLFLDGNHENHPKLLALPTKEFMGGKVGVVTNSILHLRRGEIYTINNKKILTIGGAKSYDKNMRTEGLSWWPEEEINYAETNYALENLEKNQYKVDYILAHTLPETIARMTGCISDNNDGGDSCRKFLDYVISTVEFNNFYCGHWHIDRDFNKYHILYHNVIEITNI